MEKIATAFVTSQVKLTSGISTIGVCFNDEYLSPEQQSALSEHLNKDLKFTPDKVSFVIRDRSTFIWIEIGIALCKESLSQEARHFGKILEKVGLVEKAEVYRPFRPLYA